MWITILYYKYMAKNTDYSKKILKILADKPAVESDNLVVGLLSPESSTTTKSRYAITRSLKSLSDAGFIENIKSPQNNYVRLTKQGKRKLNSINLESNTAMVNTSWDGNWRIVMLDLPENRKSERESLRYLLKKAGFVCLKNSAWISPYPFEFMFYNIKKDLSLTNEMIIFLTNTIDEITEKELYKTFGMK